MKDSISIARIKEQFVLMYQRFTVPTLFAIALALALIYMTLGEDYHGVITYYLSAGYMLSLMLDLWKEEVSDSRSVRLTCYTSHAILAIDALVLWLSNEDDYETSTYIAHGAVYLALTLGIFFLSFYKEKNDIASWNFVSRLLFNAAAAYLVGGVMTAGSCTLVGGFGVLFNIDISYKCYTVLSILFLVLLPTLLFLARMPKDAEKHNHSLLVSNFLNGITRYLFIPLVCCYIVVLLAYLCRILITWTLPNGWVSTLVSVMMCGIIIIEFLLYPTMLSGSAKKFERMMVRYLPVIAIPLLMLMSVGIIKRLSDYGITTNRLYMLTLNVWFYIVSIGLYLGKARRIHWISLSFGAILLLTSAHPYNYGEITRRVMLDRFETMLNSNPPKKVPMSRDELMTWIESLPEDKREETYASVQYLQRNYNRKRLKAWVKPDFYIWSDYKYEKEHNVISFDNYDADTLAYYVNKDGYTDIPEGYSKMRRKRFNLAPKKESIKDSILTIKLEDIYDTILVKIDIIELTKAKIEKRAIHLPDESGRKLLVPEEIEILQNNGLTKTEINTYIFSK